MQSLVDLLSSETNPETILEITANLSIHIEDGKNSNGALFDHERGLKHTIISQIVNLSFGLAMNAYPGRLDKETAKDFEIRVIYDPNAIFHGEFVVLNNNDNSEIKYSIVVNSPILNDNLNPPINKDTMLHIADLILTILHEFAHYTFIFDPANSKTKIFESNRELRKKYFSPEQIDLLNVLYNFGEEENKVIKKSEEQFKIFYQKLLRPYPTYVQTDNVLKDFGEACEEALLSSQTKTLVTLERVKKSLITPSTALQELIDELKANYPELYKVYLELIDTKNQIQYS